MYVDIVLIYSMGVSVDGFIADRDGAFAWSVPGEDQFRVHLAQTLSRTLDTVEGNARLAGAPLAEEAAAALEATDQDVAIGGAGLASAAVQSDLVDELRIFRNPVVVGGGTPFLPPVTHDVSVQLIEARRFGSGVVYERYRRGGIA